MHTLHTCFGRGPSIQDIVTPPCLSMVPPGSGHRKGESHAKRQNQATQTRRGNRTSTRRMYSSKLASVPNMILVSNASLQLLYCRLPDIFAIISLRVRKVQTAEEEQRPRWAPGPSSKPPQLSQSRQGDHRRRLRLQNLQGQGTRFDTANQDELVSGGQSSENDRLSYRSAGPLPMLSCLQIEMEAHREQHALQLPSRSASSCVQPTLRASRPAKAGGACKVPQKHGEAESHS